MGPRPGAGQRFDVSEDSPRFDSGYNTAKVAVIFIYALVDILREPDQHIL